MLTEQSRVSGNGAQGRRAANGGVELTENARVVLNKRYLRKDREGKIIETPEGMFRRVAHAIAQPELLYGSAEDAQRVEDDFYHLMSRLEFVPNSPTLMNAGIEQPDGAGTGTLSACFVLGLEDDMAGIMTTAKEAAMVQKFGGGTGFALSSIRPKGSSISTTHGQACGPVAVLRHLSSVSTLVTQGGKRDGANMAVMDVHHPDVLEFIDCKRQEGEIHNFNISVGASHEFMEAVQAGTDYPLRAVEDPRLANRRGRSPGRGTGLRQDNRRRVAERRARTYLPGLGKPGQPDAPIRAQAKIPCPREGPDISGRSLSQANPCRADR